MQRATLTAALAAALIALPAVSFAQSTTETQPPAQAQVDVAGAKQHLSAARDTLSQLTSMPEAAKLQGDARTQVSQLISNFNELITTQTDWRASYAKVDANLTALLGPDAPPDQPVGTAGSAAAVPATGAQIDPGIRGKLVEFRTQLKAFQSAAGGPVAGTSGVTTAPPAPAPAAPATAPNAEIQKELDAISGILNNSKTGALTAA